MLFPLQESALHEHTLRDWHHQQLCRLSLVEDKDSPNGKYIRQTQNHILEQPLAFFNM